MKNKIFNDFFPEKEKKMEKEILSIASQGRILQAAEPGKILGWAHLYEKRGKH